MEITPQELADRIRRGDPLFLLDVRHDWEHQLARLSDHAVIPLHELPSRLDELPRNRQLLVHCAGILRDVDLTVGAARPDHAGCRRRLGDRVQRRAIERGQVVGRNAARVASSPAGRRSARIARSSRSHE